MANSLKDLKLPKIKSILNPKIKHTENLYFYTSQS